MPGGDGSSLSPGMAHRIEVELTSQTGDSTWTWRAAGAKQPRGTVDGSLVPEGSAVGIGAPGRGGDHPGRHHGDRPAGPEGQERAPAGRADRDPRHPAARARTSTWCSPPSPSAAGTTDRTGRGTGPAGPDRASSDRDGRGDGDKRGRGDGARRGAQRCRWARRARRPTAAPDGGPARPGPAAASRADGTTPAGWPRRPPTATPPWPPSSPSSSRWPSSSSGAASPPVRQAIEEQNARARADEPARGHPRPAAGHGRAAPPGRQPGHLEGPGLGGPGRGQGRPPARAPVDRGLVVDGHARRGGQRDGRGPAHRRSTERVTALRERWVERITAALDEGRVVDAVRASIRPPEPAARLSAELAVRLADAAGQAMSAETTPGGLAGPARGGGRLAGPPHGQAGRPARRGRRGPAGRRPQGLGLRARAGPADGDPHPSAARAPSPGAGPLARPAVGPPDRRAVSTGRAGVSRARGAWSAAGP